MAILRRDDTCQDNTGNAIAGASVYYLNQPANTTTLTPLATVYSNTTGTPASNPQTSDGSGHAVAYLNSGQLYTIVYVYPNGTQVIYPDQFVGSPSGASTAFGPVVPTGTIEGTNRVFTLPFTPSLLFLWDNFPLAQGVGYTTSVIAGTFTITTATAPQVGDTFIAQGLI